MTSHEIVTDIPAPFHARAMRTLDHFDVLAATYRPLLETLAVFLTAESAAGVRQLLKRCASVARRVELCGRRLAPVHEVLALGTYDGVLTQQLRQRLAAAQSTAAALSATAAQLMTVCEARRAAAATELGTMQETMNHPAAQWSPYAAAAPMTMLLDVTR